MQETKQKMNLLPLIGLVIGSVVGGGVFNLVSDMAAGAGPVAIFIAWVICGFGMGAICFCFKNLNEIAPELNGGIYCYAYAGFGELIGFCCAWVYWIGVILSNVAFATLLFSSVDYFIPIFDGGQNIASIVGASVLLWFVHFLIVRGVRSAAILNVITAISKLIPILLFIICTIIFFKKDIFIENFSFGTGTLSWSILLDQVKSTMLVTVWVFSGIEGATVFSNRAKNRKDVGKATIYGFIGVLIMYMFVSLLPLGVINQGDLARMDQPSMAYVLEILVGKWGAIIINIGLIISVLGAWLSWTLIACEIPYQAAKDKIFPKFFLKENTKGTPIVSLCITNGIIQLFFLTFLITDEVYTSLYSLAAFATLLPYAFSAIYQVKCSYSLKSVGFRKEILIGLVAGAYSTWLLLSSGLNYLLLLVLLITPGIFIYFIFKKELGGSKILSKVEWLVAFSLICLAGLAIWMVITGSIVI